MAPLNKSECRKSYNCDVCEFKTADQKYLLVHKEHLHSVSRKMCKCPHCNVELSKFSLQTHINMVHLKG